MKWVGDKRASGRNLVLMEMFCILTVSTSVSWLYSWAILLPVSPWGKLSKVYRGSLCYFLEQDVNLQFSKIKVNFFKEQNILFHQNLSARSHKEKKRDKTAWWGRGKSSPSAVSPILSTSLLWEHLCRSPGSPLGPDELSVPFLPGLLWFWVWGWWVGNIPGAWGASRRPSGEPWRLGSFPCRGAWDSVDDWGHRNGPPLFQQMLNRKPDRRALSWGPGQDKFK